MTKIWFKSLLGLGALTLTAACGADAGTGTAVVRLSGEEAAQHGIGEHDHEGGHEHAEFVDGWHVHFDKYIVAVGHVSLKSSDGTVGATSNDVFVADLHKGDVELVRFDDLEARRWDDFSFQIVAPTAGAKNVNGVAQADIDRMIAAGANYLVAGEAHKDGEEVTFEWLLRNPTRNSACTNGDDDKQGIVVTNSGTARALITLHVEHLFWDSLGSEATPRLRFDAIAAMADASGVVEFDALESRSLAQPVDAEGSPLKDEDGSNVIYDPAGHSLPAPGLKGFILASSATQAHLNGEGLCTIASQR